MPDEIFVKRSRLQAPSKEVFAWHCRKGALMRLTPPWERVGILEESPDLADGSLTSFWIKAGPVKFRWKAVHEGYRQDEQFTDRQVKGPFARWEHTHCFIPDGKYASFMEDRIRYRLPLHRFMRFLAGTTVTNRLERMFRYRHRIIADDIKNRPKTGSMRIAVTGASGLIGNSLIPFLSTQGHEIIVLKRTAPTGKGEAYWDPATGVIDCPFDNVDAVIHLAGEAVGSGIWTKKKKEMILKSRTDGTRLLSEAMASAKNPPRTFLCASAIGYYGDRVDDLVSEDDAPGPGFLAEVCKEWEDSASAAEKRGIRVCFMRIGIVLHPAGGALQRLIGPVRLGLGGTIGPGMQFMSWITMEDLINGISHLLSSPEIRGPVNLTAPKPVRNRDFIKTLAGIMGRPAFLKIPALLIRLIFGEMGEEALLSSTRASSEKLERSGFTFKYNDLTSALKYLLGRDL